MKTLPFSLGDKVIDEPFYMVQLRIGTVIYIDDDKITINWEKHGYLHGVSCSYQSRFFDTFLKITPDEEIMYRIAAL